MSTINQPQSGPHKGLKDVRKRPSMSVLDPCQIVLLQDSAALRTLSCHASLSVQGARISGACCVKAGGWRRCI